MRAHRLLDGASFGPEANDESRNVEALTRGALEAMARNYKDTTALGAPFTRVGNTE
jgi:hypothetical protein